MQYTNEELLRACQDFFGGVYWAWYSASLKVVGEEKTHEVLMQIAGNFSEMEASFMKMLWGGEFNNLQELSKALDVVHRMVAYEGWKRGSVPEWKWTNENKGYEQIGHCPIYAATPEEFKDKGPTALCTIYCHTIGKKFYGKMGCTIEQDRWLSKGETHCGFHIERLVNISAESANV